MKLNKINFIILFTLLLSAITQILAKDLDTYINKNNPANDPKIEIAILSELLKEQHYKELGFDEFRQRCLDYFGIDIKQVQTTDGYFQCIEGVSGCYNIALNQEFLSTFGESIFYDPSNPKAPTINQVKTKLRHKNNQLAQQFIAYNKLLFNDDISVNSFFLNRESIDYIVEVVFRFDYEKNELLYYASIPHIAATINQIATNQHLLFYNNPKRGYKKRLLNDLYIERGVVGVEKIIDATYDNWEKLKSDLYGVNNKKITVDESLQDRVLLHLIKLISHHQDEGNSLNKSEQLAYKYLMQFFEKDTQLEKRFEQNNYYDMGLIVLPKENRVVSEKRNELLENRYITQSNDNYVNLRKEPNTKSEVIKKLPNHTQLIKIKAIKGWYYVQLVGDNGTRGYIHISQLAYLNK